MLGESGAPYRISCFISLFILMKRQYLLLGLIFFCTALFAEDWTVLIYMGADNDLAAQALENLQDMEQIEQAAGLNLIVQLDLPESGAKRYKIEHKPQAGFNSRILQSLGTVDSGDPHTLQEFMLWGFDNYPASRKMLIIWSHGDSWYKQNKYISVDEESGNAIRVANGELSAAFSGVPKLDILLFDACSMQSIEIAYELRHFADYIIGSADLVPVKGFPYQTMIPLFSQDPHSVASQIPNLYLEHYLPGTQNNPSNYFLNISCSAIDTSELNSFYDFFAGYSRKLKLYATQLMKIREDLYDMNTAYADVDMKQMLTRIIEYAILPQQSSLALQHLEQLIIASAYSSTYYQPDLSSLAIWFPDVRYNFATVWEIYMQLAFAQSSWLSVVNAALGDDQYAPAAPKLKRQYQYHGRLHLHFEAPVDVDSLYYHVQSDHADIWLYPPMYAGDFQVSFPIDSSGNCRIYALDQSGNASQTLSIDYEREMPVASLVVRPNPVKTGYPAFLDWYLEADNIYSAQLSLYNIKGQKLVSFSSDTLMDPVGSIMLQDIPGFGSLKRGMYIIEYRAKGKRLRSKLAIL